MSRIPNFESESVPPPLAISARFFAHAELCRQIAAQCLDEEIARKLEQLAQECLRAAGTADRPVLRH